LYNSGATELLVDLTGFLPATSGYAPLTPDRLIDTRVPVNGLVPAGSITPVNVSTADGVPPGAIAAAMNVTVVSPAAAGFVTVFPCDEAMPTASNLNYGPGQTVPNGVVSKLGASGNVCIYNSAALEFIVDLTGTFSGPSFEPFNPKRLLDTRFNPGAPAAADSVQTIQVAGADGIAVDATAASVNVTVTQTQGPGYVTIFPCGVEPPVASNLNYTGAGQTIAVGSITALSESGALCVYTLTGTHLIVDVNGVFVPSG